MEVNEDNRLDSQHEITFKLIYVSSILILIGERGIGYDQ